MTAIRWDQSRTALGQILATMRECFISEWDGMLTMKAAHPEIPGGVEVIVPTGWWISRARGPFVRLTPEEPVE